MRSVYCKTDDALTEKMRVAGQRFIADWVTNLVWDSLHAPVWASISQGLWERLRETPTERSTDANA